MEYQNGDMNFRCLPNGFRHRQNDYLNDFLLSDFLLHLNVA
ncbi:hypothetical protein [Clostridium sp. AF50-3]|nr:hypothetical protein [Clostridium sp. AF50-3]